MTGVFDDLIPTEKVGAFDDLIPKSSKPQADPDSFEAQLEGGESMSPDEIARLENRADMAIEQERARKTGERAAYASEVAIPGLEKGVERLTFSRSPLGPVAGVMETVGDVAAQPVKAVTDFSGELALSLMEDLGSGDIARGAPRTLNTLTTKNNVRSEAGELSTGPRLAQEFVRTAGAMGPALIANRFGVPMHVAFGTQMGMTAYAETGDADFASRQAAFVTGG